MTAWQTDDEYISVQTAISLPTPTDTPYRTPSQTSKRSRRSATPPSKGVSPSRMANGEKSSKRSSRISMEESLSILDPRRFTPTLHANLVSEILTLRRDQEEKTKLIENLESALQISREEQETLQENIANTSKETRSLKRQLSLLEGGTSSALGELARERDEAVDSVADARKRLDVAQKKIRSQEEDSQRVHDLWAQEKEDWEDEKRKFERRVHVAESRLKTVLEEMEVYQANVNGVQTRQDCQDSEGDESGREQDAASVRTMSMTNSIRFTFTGGMGSMLNGNSLADELNFDDTDDQTDMDGGESIMSSPRHKRTFSRDSVASKIHHRNRSMESLKRPGSVARGRLFMNEPVLEALEGVDEETRPSTPAPVPKTSYTDTGIQFSPPPSPKLESVKPITPNPPVLEKLALLESSPRSDSEYEANQRRKRVSRPLTIEPLKMNQRMVSSAAQTIELPLSPPKTPKSPYTDSATSPDLEPSKMVTSSTQTDAPAAKLVRASSATFPLTLEIPSINIEPPRSLPTSPLEPRLPQHFKHFGCQVNLSSQVEMAESSCQTESIQTDKRLALLPLHLQPSSITSRPPSPNPSVEITAENEFSPLPTRNPRRLTKGSLDLPSSPMSFGRLDDDVHDDHDFDDGPMSSQRSVPIRRPRHYSSFHSGIYSGSSDEMDEFGDDISDTEYRTALSAPRPPSAFSRPVRRNSSIKSPTSPEGIRSGRSSARSIHTELYSSYSLGDRQFKNGKPVRNVDKPLPSLPRSSSRSSVRKAAMIQSGIASHRARSRSPSLIDPVNPPFPIPARASSRKPSISISIPSDGRESPSIGVWQRKNSASRNHFNDNVRRVRSANTLACNGRYRRNGSRSPPLSPSTEAPESPALPPLPRNDITTPRDGDGSGGYRRHRSQLSTNTDVTTNTELQSQAGSQTPGVVEAIAQTMVGEWMFKYVRRRKSFGVPDNAGKDDSSNDRHKRWVWLAPYERAILWSSKQPSSGSALMGKAGRKLVIQSVLDVKDDNPPPRGANTTVFNRSILILTPQRALKFTATTTERHYLWLTALSFLAHSSQAVPDILSPAHLSVKQKPLPDFNVSRTKLKRGGIRDSIRIAKGRPVYKTDLPDVPSIPSAPASRMGEVASFRLPEGSVAGPGNHAREPSGDAAEPPMIPRFTDRNPAPIAHGRKRSNTGSHIHPPLSFRGFSGPLSSGSNHQSANSTTNASIITTGSSDIYPSQGSTNITWGTSQAASSDISSQPGNFFDAIGTVRMEAFISPLAFSQFTDDPDEEEEFRYAARRRSKDMRRKHSRNRHRDNPYARGRRGYDDYYGGNKTTGEEDFFRDDPFRGF
ncbi:Anucleate primary sterigmata protein A [Cladobotryum mycophilum]|uniref:Anucleate primary sterigmata protein A n=1 Tax=Cladobotryum mycophilum TaxID=491253 RepID=A0ABR0SJU2_9HYPO